ncbi:MAG: hypothetical protein SVY15_02570 [Halobacteriota archaeon]|nr:hypothetical protein [Halobacteriota archaeon]
MDVEGIYGIKREIEAVGEGRLVELESIFGKINSAIAEFDGKPNKYVYRVELVKQLDKIARKIQNSKELSPEDIENFDLVLSFLKKWRFTSAKDAIKVFEPLASLREKKKSLIEYYRREYNILKEREKAIKNEISRLEGLVDYPDVDEEDIALQRGLLEEYNTKIAELMRDFSQFTPSREVIKTGLDALYHPELRFPNPYDQQSAEELYNFLKSEKIGEEPVYKLLDYYRYSQDRLAHYLDNPVLFKEVSESNVAWLESLNELGKRSTARITFGEDGASINLRITCVIPFISRIGRITNTEPDDAVEYLISLRKLINSGRYDIILESDRLKGIYTTDEIQKMKDGGLDEEVESLKEELERIEEELEIMPDPKEL